MGNQSVDQGMEEVDNMRGVENGNRPATKADVDEAKESINGVGAVNAVVLILSTGLLVSLIVSAQNGTDGKIAQEAKATREYLDTKLSELAQKPKVGDPNQLINQLSPAPTMSPDELRKLSLAMGKKAEEFRAAATQRELASRQAEIQRQMDELERKRKELASTH